LLENVDLMYRKKSKNWKCLFEALENFSKAALKKSFVKIVNLLGELIKEVPFGKQSFKSASKKSGNIPQSSFSYNSDGNSSKQNKIIELIVQG